MAMRTRAPCSASSLYSHAPKMPATLFREPLLSFLLLLSCHYVCGKKMEATSSFDVKPTGQVAHHVIELVSSHKVV